jgi:hypothetical protein
MSHPASRTPGIRLAFAAGACALILAMNGIGCATSEEPGATGEGGSTGAAGQAPAGSSGSGHGGTTAGGEGGHIATGEGGHVAAGEGGHVAPGEGGSTTSGHGGNASGSSGGTVTSGNGGSTASGHGGSGTAGSGTSGRGGGSAAGGSGGANTAGGGAGAGGSGGATGATFAAVAAILMSNCTTAMCHDGAAGSTKTDLRNNSGLRGRIVSVTDSKLGPTCNGKTIIVPGQPTMSLLYQKVSGTGIPSGCGDKMPDECPSKRPCLTTAQVETIRDWIAAGAPM